MEYSDPRLVAGHKQHADNLHLDISITSVGISMQMVIMLAC